MLDAGSGELAARAARLAAGSGGTIVASSARVGGGALPLLELRGPAVALEPGAAGAERLARALRTGTPPVIGRIEDGRVVLDPRTLTDAEADAAAAAAAAALRAVRA
jgi:L-seryl-tRNA(Ser) seleniumtransferase